MKQTIPGFKSLKSIWSAGLKIGYNPSLPGLERSRIMVLNGVMFVTCFSVFIFFVIYGIVGYQYYYGPLYIIPVALTVLNQNRLGNYVAARNIYFAGSLAIISYWCYEGRGNGNEYTLIALATTSSLLFHRRSALYLINIACAGVFVLYRIYHSSYPFNPDPSINYDVLPWIILMNSVAVGSFQMAFFRDLVHHYDKKLVTRYKELNVALDQKKITEEELKTSNEALEQSNVKLHDLTHQLEVVVKRKSTELQSYIEAINVNIYSCINDRNGLFIMVNEPLIAASGYSREELIGKHYDIFDSDHYSQTFFRERAEGLWAGKTWIGEVRNKRKDDSFFWFDCVVIPIRDEDEKISCFLSLGLPITERKLNEQMREETQRLLETIAFRTSHKIRGPLARVEGLTNLIKNDSITKNEFALIAANLAECAEELKMATTELVEFVNDHRSSIEAIH